MQEGKAWEQVSLQMKSDTCALLHVYDPNYACYVHAALTVKPPVLSSQKREKIKAREMKERNLR